MTAVAGPATRGGRRPPPPIRGAHIASARSPEAPRGSRSLWWAALGWGVPAIHLAATFDKRWIPHDEGTLAQPAWRILLGEVPHRDFDATYTGLLEYLHAGAMAVLGTHLLSLRVVFLLVALAWLATVWRLARRFVPPPAAALATILAGALGPVNYPAAMPSWYNLFLATWGVWALVRWTEDRRDRWLVLAGALAGLSMLVKIVGLYLLAAALFAVLHASLEPPAGAARGAPQGEADPWPGPPREGPDPSVDGRGAAAGALLAAAALVALPVLELLLVRSQAGPAALAHYVLPTAALAAVGLWRLGRGGARPDVARTARRWSLLLLGTAAVVVPFVLAFAAAGAADDLYRGVFVLPRLRLDGAANPPTPLARSWGMLLLVGVVALALRVPVRTRRVLAVAVALLGALVAAGVAGGEFSLYLPAWNALALLVPVAVATGAVVLVGAPPTGRRGAAVAVLWAAALIGLVGFPFATPTYFVQVAPLGVLALAAAASEAAGGRADAATPRERPALAVLALAVVAFLFAGPNRWGLFEPFRVGDTVPMGVERARIDVPPLHAQEYATLVQAVGELSRSEWIYATPDVPEVYFLTGRRNPTRTLFEVLDMPPLDPEALLRTLDERGVNVVVLNRGARFSPLAPDLVARLEARFPRSGTVGRFRLLWR